LNGERHIYIFADYGREGGFNFLPEIKLKLTDDALARSRSDLYGKIVDAVEESAALLERRAAALAAGDFRRQLAIESDVLIRGELHRGCVEVLQVAWNYKRDPKEPDPPPGDGQLPPYKPDEDATALTRALFFERLFEWSAMTFSLLPYHVAPAGQWLDQLTNADSDPLLARFLRSGAAQVLVPVQHGQEPAFLHYRRCGKSWSGPGTPLPADDRLLAGLGEVEVGNDVDPGEDTARPEGEPWSIIMRTGISVLDCEEVILLVFAIRDVIPFRPGSKACYMDGRPYNELEWPDALKVCNGLRDLGYDVPLVATPAAAKAYLLCLRHSWQT
jgi:hypothetical protein